MHLKCRKIPEGTLGITYFYYYITDDKGDWRAREDGSVGKVPAVQSGGPGLGSWAPWESWFLITTPVLSVGRNRDGQIPEAPCPFSIAKTVYYNVTKRLCLN